MSTFLNSGWQVHIGRANVLKPGSGASVDGSSWHDSGFSKVGGDSGVSVAVGSGHRSGDREVSCWLIDSTRPPRLPSKGAPRLYVISG